MPITLRNVHPDAAAKLRQLEVDAAAVDRAARDLIPEELRYRSGPPLAGRVAAHAKAYLGPASQAAADFLASLARTLPYLAATFRFLRGVVADALLCISVAGGVLLAFALLVLVLAPPA